MVEGGDAFNTTPNCTSFCCYAKRLSLSTFLITSVLSVIVIVLIQTLIGVMEDVIELMVKVM